MSESSDSLEAARARCLSSSRERRPDPGKIHAGQVGVATLSDPRLDFLASLHKPKKVTPASVEFLDTPGLMLGSHADNPQRLALIREGDALLIVLNGFAGGDPAAQLAAFRDEMLFADLTVVTTRVERLEASLKKPRPDRERVAKELEIVKAVQAVLEEGKTVASLDLSAEDKKPLRSFGLLTDKPEVVLLNTIQGQPIPESLLALAPESLAIDAKLELELSQLDPEERAAFMTRPGHQRTRPRIESSAEPTMPSASSHSSPPVSPRFAAGTSSAAHPPSKPPARSTPTWPRASSAPKSPPSTTSISAAPSRKPKPSICNGSKARTTSSRTATSSTSAAPFERTKS